MSTANAFQDQPRRDPSEVLSKHYGFSSFRPGQKRLIDACLAGRDALGVLPTGGGKTLCFQIPAFVLPGTVLVVSPLISLMADQASRAAAVGLRSACLTSHESEDAQRAIEQEFVSGQLDLLLVSPERLAVQRFLDLVVRGPVSLLAVDEAHCISEWGHEFRPAFRGLGSVRRALSVPTLAVTATATPTVRNDICQVLALRDPVTVIQSFDRPNIAWHLLRCPPGWPRLRRVHHAVVQAKGASIIYAPTRRQVVSVRRGLAGLGVVAEAYHAGMPQDLRGQVQSRFLSGESSVVVATNAFGMGIDRGDVAFVAHMALPGSLESYYQEAGRAGRDGRRSLALAFVWPGDADTPLRFLEDTYPPPGDLRVGLRLLRSLPADKKGGLILGTTTWTPKPLGPAVLRWLDRLQAIRLTPGSRTFLRDFSDDDPDAVAESVCLEVTGRPLVLAPLVRARRIAEERLFAVRDFAQSRECRRKRLLRYLGEVSQWRSCRACDRCTLSFVDRAFSWLSVRRGENDVPSATTMTKPQL